MDSRHSATADLPPRLRWAEGGVLLAALAVRGIALADFETTLAAEHPMVDAYTYWQQAQSLFAGRDPFAEGYYQPPAYPWLLSLWGGWFGEMSLTAVRRVQLLLGIVTTGCILQLGRALGMRLGLPWLGVLAGGLFVLSPTPMLFELDVLTPAVTLASSTAGAMAFVRAWQRESAVWAILGGVLVGFACAVHPTYLLAAVAAALAWVVHVRHTPTWWLPALFSLGVAAPLLPTTEHNARQFGVFELVSHNGGLNFYLGNNPNMRETAFLRPGLPFRKLVLEADPASRILPERNAYWWSRARSEAMASPVAALAVLGAKAVWSVNDVEIPRNEDYRCRTAADQPLHWVSRLPGRFGLLFPLALIGAWTLVRRRDETSWTVAIWAALHSPMVLFLVSDRYRVATWPVLVLLGSLGLFVLVRQRQRMAWGWLAAGLLVAWLPIDGRTAMDPAWCRYQEANLQYMGGDRQSAKEGYTAVVAQDGWQDDMGAHYWLGRLAESRKDWPETIEHLDVVLRQFPDHYPTLKARADASYYAGRKDECADHLLRAYRVPGDRTSTGVKLVKLLRRMGRDEEARTLLAADPKLAAHPKLQ